ncbi:MAG: hypothetical protein J2P45_14210 [Candidatus Dormibacteraeota bacterium]|nr:hypothetical protein [Candidatus Dormibacteraeota bacterium]
MEGRYPTLSPWAEVDPVPLEGITPRLSDLRGKRIGLFENGKVAARPILEAVQAELGARFEGTQFTSFTRRASLEVAETPDKDAYEQWAKEVDAVVLAVGD